MNLKIILSYIKIPFKYSKKISLLLIFSGIFYAFIFNLATFLLSKTIDIVTNVSNYGIYLNISIIAFYIISMGILFIITNLQTYFRAILKSIVYTNSKRELYIKKFNLDYKLNENKEILDLFNILDNFDENIIDFVQSLIFFITLSIQLLILFLMISYFSIITSVVVFTFTIIIIALVAKGGNANYLAHKKVQTLEREQKVLETALVSYENCEERKLFNFKSHLSKLLYKKSEEIRIYKNKKFSIWFLKSQSGSILFILLTVIIIVILMYSLINKQITFGFFIALFTTFIQLSDVMAWDLSDNIDKFIKSLSINSDYIKFMELEEENNSKSNIKINNSFHKLSIENVCFSYPNSNKKILNDITIKFEKGKKYAIVGENGCGKTTLVKIILGLYKNYDGKILFYSENHSVINLEDIKKDISVVFQDYAKYYISIRDCLNLGVNTTISDEKILKILKHLKIGINIEDFPNGLDTSLGNIFENGTNLSGGQWQKLSLARALLSNSSIIILDEPTSALDPISEVSLLKDFEKLCTDKTLIYISHRLGLTKNVDEIIVINQGIIEEKGTHCELINLNGLYKKMYDTQKSWYVDINRGDNFV